MHVPSTCLLLVLVALSVAADEPQQDSTKAISLKAIRPGDGEHDGADFLQIRATLDITRTQMTSVDRIEFYLYPAGGDGRFQMLAVAEQALAGFSVRFGWQNVCPKVGSLNKEWPAEQVRMVGSFGNPTSFAQLNWLTESAGYCFIYKAVVVGLDSLGQVNSIYRTFKVKASNGCNVKPTTTDIINALIQENNLCLASAPDVQSQANQVATELQRASSVSDLGTQLITNMNDLDTVNQAIVAFQSTQAALTANQVEITSQSGVIDVLNSTFLAKAESYASRFQVIEDTLKKMEVLERLTALRT
ncbi:hypothetical protein EGW08_011126 [Elysia chlorotica]|uniref:Uncharacterized protein n=1 Tax=Elysia chlorotica TaxID=188477 RepID=A0A433THU3_ELYCH|nr:hypothetical protein EGW08_011126 [Elysia chlorotica]